MAAYLTGRTGLSPSLSPLVSSRCIKLWRLVDPMTRSVSIFGATGSVGLSTLDLIRQHRGDYRVVVTNTAGSVTSDIADEPQ